MSPQIVLISVLRYLNYQSIQYYNCLVCLRSHPQYTSEDKHKYIAVFLTSKVSTTQRITTVDHRIKGLNSIS